MLMFVGVVATPVAWFLHQITSAEPGSLGVLPCSFSGINILHSHK
jgi:hypothetical protein